MPHARNYSEIETLLDRRTGGGDGDNDEGQPKRGPQETAFLSTKINVMIDILEAQIHLANEKQDKVEFVIARDFSEFEQALRQSKIPIAHAIEGAHALGRNVA